MSTDFSKIQMLSSASSNKVLLEGSGTLSVNSLGTSGETHTTATIAHNFGSDNLLFQVSTNGGPTDGVMLPWESSDSRIIQYASIDDTNLYITVNSNDSSGYGAGAFTITYYYRVLIP
jgi:hypothetical protein